MLCLAFWVYGLITQTEVLAQSSEKQNQELLSLSLEELMNVEVTSAFKKPQSLKETPAAVYVITQDDIRRSGATSIPDLLRMVPGVNVAKIDNGNWAISIRGFNGLFSDKLLVLMDGRTLYDPLFSGMFWDVQDTMLEDIERIEVIRGPGAASWGINAVNGVINIITRDAWSTTGGLLSGGGGGLEHGFGSVRYGFKVGDIGAVRVYAKAFKQGGQDTAKGATAWDARRMLRSGFHSDWNFTRDDAVTLQGDIYTGDDTTRIQAFNTSLTGYETVKKDVPVSGGNILSRWTHLLGNGEEFSFQFYYDHTDRKFTDTGSEGRDTFDLELRHRFRLFGFNDFQWGAGYRHTWDDISMQYGRHYGTFDPTSRKDDLFSLFFQNEMTFIRNRLHFLFGIRLDHNNYTGMEVQPTARLLYNLTSHQNVWAAISRAVRVPSRYNRDAIWVLGASFDKKKKEPLVTGFIGDDSFGTEKLWAAELGYRWSTCRKLSLDMTGFANFYDDLFAATTGEMFEHYGLIILPVFPENYGKANNYGVELTGNYRPLDWWRMEVSYSYLNTNYWVEAKHRDNSAVIAKYMEAPDHQVSFRSSMNITEAIDFDLWLRYVSSLQRLDVPSYTGLDLRLAWRPLKTLELSMNAKNLLDPRHPEYRDEFLLIQSTEVPRSVYGKVSWTF